MKKILLFIFVFVLVAVAGFYFLNSKLTASNSIDELIPETSLFAIRLEKFSQDLTNYESFDNVDLISESKRLFRIKDQLDSLKNQGEIPNSLLNLETWVSVHSNGSDGLNTLFFVKSDRFEWSTESIRKVLEMLTGDRFATETQIFNGETIFKLSSPKRSISYGIIGEYLFLSSEALLVEDVLRAKTKVQNRLFEEAQPKEATAYSLYLNGRRLSELSRIFVEDPTKILNDLDAVFGIEIDENNSRIIFRGLGNRMFSSGLKESQLFGKNFIPVQSAYAEWYPLELVQDRALTESLSPQVLKVGLEEGDAVWLMQVSDTINLARELNQMAVSNLKEADSTVYNEQFMFTKIGFIEDDSFLLTLSSDLPKTSFYHCFIQDNWLFSSSLDALKTTLLDFDEERTLGRNVQKRKELDGLVQETSYTLIKNFNFGTELFERQLKKKWSDYFDKKSGLKNRLNQFTLQANNIGNKSLVSGSLSFNIFKKATQQVSSVSTLNKAQVVSNLFAQDQIITKPFVVRNHLNSQIEVVFQDNGKRLYLSSLQGEILWDKPLDGAVLGNISQIDFYNNKKLQLLFVTDSLLHLIDRNGNYVEGFPVAYESQEQIENVSVVDYDNSKRYRYLLEGNQGNVTLLDKNGRPLEGWNPKAYENPLQFTPFHTRVRGTDCFVVVDYLGNFDLINRRSQSYNGFPVNTGLRLSGQVFYQKGPNLSSTSMVMLGRDGKLSSINFLGKTIDRKQLFKPNAQTSFELLDDVGGTTYRILQKSIESALILDESGNELFQLNDYTTSDKIAFYNFRNGKGIYAIQNKERNKLKLISETGQILADEISCDQPVSILFYQNTQEYQVFVNFTNQLTQYTVNAI